MNSRQSVAAILLCVIACQWCGPARVCSEELNATQIIAPAGSKHALLICGLSGDAGRRKAFAETITKVHSALVTKLGFPAENVSVLFGDESREELGEHIQSVGVATKQELEGRIQGLREKLEAQDSLWVIAFGHTHYDGENSWLNLPGPDINQLEFARLFAPVRSGQQVFLITVPASGFFIKSLSAERRIVITATEADWETNETEFGSEFARILASPPPIKELDIDQDGLVSLFDLYVVVARNLAQSFRDRELLATEHSLLDDNGDGRGTEVQINFLTTELGGRLRVGDQASTTLPPKSDGQFAKTILLPIGE
jgi:hypothetical protein